MIERIMLELLGTHSVGSLLSRDVLGTLSSTITFVFHPHAVRSSVGSHPADKAPRLFEQPDPVGAFLIHALLVCNTDPALELAFKLLSVMPKLMLQVHTGQPFQDETALHVLSVNRREHLAIEYVDMVVAHFAPEQVRAHTCCYQSMSLVCILSRGRTVCGIGVGAASSTHTRTRAHAHTCTRAHAHTCTRAHVHTCTRAHAHTCTRAQVQTCTGACALEHAGRQPTTMSTHAHAHARTHTPAHAHARTHTPAPAHAHIHAQVRVLLNTQAVGVFFDSEPMCW